MTTFWDELQKRVAWIRDLYSKHRINMPAGEGLSAALSEADACARREVKASASGEDVFAAIQACHVVWALFDSMKGCVDSGLDITSHLRQIGTGSVDYGHGAKQGTANSIYFKDFETELFVAASLARAGLPVTFMDEPNDPSGEMKVGSIFVEVKHPDASNSHEKLMRKFNGELRKSSSAGVFVTALEDAFEMSPQVASSTEFASWHDAKGTRIEAFGLEAVRRAARLRGILALIQTSSAVEIIGDDTRFVRRTNGLLFDNRECDATVLALAERIVSVFNPSVPRYSQVTSLLANRHSGG